MKRNHPLFVGEIVFDVDNGYFGVITELTDNKAVLDMCGKHKGVDNIPHGWCEMENKTMFDEEISEEEMKWETTNLDMLYQIAWGIKDSRTENIVCYEHIDDGELKDYPYFSPYLNENLYGFETEPA